jgi:serine/threonine protein kinase
MKSRFASVRTGGGLNRVDRAVQLLEDEWQRHGEVQLEHFWAQQQCAGLNNSKDAPGALAELAKADLRCRFEHGQTPTAAGYLERFPQLQANHSRILSLVYEEYCLNEERGLAPDVESFCNRYPDWKSSLASQLKYHRLFSQATGQRQTLPVFPEPGQDFEEFRLLALLGTGGSSRVFLARDLSLGGKQVVLKVALDRGQEPKVHGPLDHPHIVPVNSVVYQSEGNLCGLCMPYRPGLPLDEVITRVDPSTRPRKAIVLWQSLVDRATVPSNLVHPSSSKATAGANEPFTAPKGDGWEGFPVRGTYPLGVAWIVMILARALHYAHGMNTFHRDVKPANVLLTLKNGPQLLDFNLAESPHSADHAHAALHGGTLPYMAPEQIEAFINPDLWEKVGAGADIYSLGLVLRELLTGEKPELPDPALPPARALSDALARRPFLDVAVRRFNPEIPYALEAIVAKCLTLSTDDRYTSAQELENDLDRFLKFQPLKYASNPSRRERARNWLVRHRRILATAAALLIIGAVYPVYKKLNPPIETTRAFVSAVDAFESGNSADAARRFRVLEQADPQSSLVKFYLGFALRSVTSSRDDGIDEADQQLTRALAPRNVARSLTSWSKGHPEFVSHLVEFAEDRMVEADKAAQKCDDGSRLEDEDRRNLVREPKYKLAAQALKVAEELDQSSTTIQRLLAQTEEGHGNYAAAYERVARLINSFDPTAMNDSSFFSHELRGWVVLNWAEQELSKKSVNSQTLRRLEEAREDFDFCSRFLAERSFGDTQSEKKYYVMQHGLRTKVATAEVELAIGPLPEAKKHLDECGRALRDLDDYIDANYPKAPPTTPLKQRIEDALNSLAR